MDSTRLRLTFWGVRGSTPTPALANLRHGGNTACVEVRGPGDEVLIFDGGTGIRPLGESLLARYPDRRLDVGLFLTHFHWDHVQGIPFFGPLYSAANEVDFYTACLSHPLREVIEGQMAQPFFPVTVAALAGARNYEAMDGTPVRRGPFTVHSFPLNHPQGASGYRIECCGRSVVYATDHEHGVGALDASLRDHAQGADVLIYDAQYTPEEYGQRRGWGHSTWEEATRVAADAGVRQLVLFHHDPSHDDAFLDRTVDEARRRFPATSAARERWDICL